MNAALRKYYGLCDTSCCLKENTTQREKANNKHLIILFPPSQTSNLPPKKYPDLNTLVNIILLEKKSTETMLT